MALNNQAGRLYATDRAGDVVAIDTQSGKILWQLPQVNADTSPVVAKDGTVYVGTSDNYLYAIRGLAKR